MHTATLITVLSLFSTLSFAAPTPLIASSLATIAEAEAGIANSLPLHQTSTPHTTDPDEDTRTYGVYFHVADSSADTAPILDLVAVEAAKEAMKERIEKGNGLKDRITKFRGGMHRPRGEVEAELD